MGQPQITSSPLPSVVGIIIHTFKEKHLHFCLYMLIQIIALLGEGSINHSRKQNDVAVVFIRYFVVPENINNPATEGFSV